MKVNLDVIRPPSVTPFGIKTVNRVAHSMKWLAKPEFGSFERRYGDMFLATKVGEDLPYSFSFVNKEDKVVVCNSYIGEISRYDQGYSNVIGEDVYGVAWNTMWLTEQNPNAMLFYLIEARVNAHEFIRLMGDIVVYLADKYRFRLKATENQSIEIYNLWRSGVNDTQKSLRLIDLRDPVYSVSGAVRGCLNANAYTQKDRYRLYSLCNEVAYDNLRKIMDHDDAYNAISDAFRANMSLETVLTSVGHRRIYDGGKFI